MPTTSSNPLPAESIAAAPALALPVGGSLFLTVFPSVMLPVFLAAPDQTIVATALPRAHRLLVRHELADAFRGAFLAIAAFGTGGLRMAWWLPVRRI